MKFMHGFNELIRCVCYVLSILLYKTQCTGIYVYKVSNIFTINNYSCCALDNLMYKWSTSTRCAYFQFYYIPPTNDRALCPSNSTAKPNGHLWASKWLIKDICNKLSKTFTTDYGTSTWNIAAFLLDSLILRLSPMMCFSSSDIYMKWNRKSCVLEEGDYGYVMDM